MMNNEYWEYDNPNDPDLGTSTDEGEQAQEALVKEGETHAVVDIEAIDHGSIVTFRPITVAAREWVEGNVSSEGWQWIGGALAVDWRMASQLVQGIREEGLVIG